MADDVDSTDVDLLAAWRAGDRVAGNRLVARHFAAVYRFVRRRAPERTAANDLAQRTFLALLESGDRHDPSRRMRAYLLGIAQHLVFRDVRDAARGQHARATPAASVISPSGAAAASERKSLLRRALEALPLELRTTLEMHYWDELTTSEIGEILGIAAGTVKWRLSRGRALLRDEIVRLAPDAATRESTLHRLDQLGRGRGDAPEEPA